MRLYQTDDRLSLAEAAGNHERYTYRCFHRLIGLFRVQTLPADTDRPRMRINLRVACDSDAAVHAFQGC